MTWWPISACGLICGPRDSGSISTRMNTAVRFVDHIRHNRISWAHQKLAPEEGRPAVEAIRVRLMHLDDHTRVVWVDEELEGIGSSHYVRHGSSGLDSVAPAGGLHCQA